MIWYVNPRVTSKSPRLAYAPCLHEVTWRMQTATERHAASLSYICISLCRVQGQVLHTDLSRELQPPDSEPCHGRDRAVPDLPQAFGESLGQTIDTSILHPKRRAVRADMRFLEAELRLM